MSVNFRDPPLNEVILGIQINPEALPTNKMLDTINHLKSDFPEIKEMPLLPAIFNDKGEHPIQKFLSDHYTRFHLIERNKARSIQIQPDRILLNWQKTNDKSEYPRYNNLLEAFLRIVTQISKTISEDITKHINQYEMAYVAHVYLEDFGNKHYPVHRILNMLTDSHDLTGIDIDLTISKPSVGGSLNITVKSAQNTINQKRLLVLENSCRGFISTETHQLKQWFNTAHDILITQFVDMITDEAKKKWGYAGDKQ